MAGAPPVNGNTVSNLNLISMFKFECLINIAEMTKFTKMLRYGYFGPLNWTSRLNLKT